MPLIPSDPWCLRASVPRWFCASVTYSLDASVLQHLGAQELPSSVASVPSVPWCSIASVPWANLPPQDKHILCVQCLGRQHASSALEDRTFCPICANSMERTLQRRLAEFTGKTSTVEEASVASGAPSFPLLHLPLSPLHSIQSPAPRAHSHSGCPARSSKKSRDSWQAKDISDLKNQMAQVLEYLVRQQAIAPAPAPAPPLAPVPEQILPSLAVDPVLSEQDVAMSKEEQDAISIEASWDGESIGRPEVQETSREAGQSSEEADVTLSSSSVRVLME
ncbi:UNVERIFIED_CONTAM: hypothetical protein FKN15_035370 [Acipenser sinensis]